MKLKMESFRHPSLLPRPRSFARRLLDRNNKRPMRPETFEARARRAHWHRHEPRGKVVPHAWCLHEQRRREAGRSCHVLTACWARFYNIVEFSAVVTLCRLRWWVALWRGWPHRLVLFGRPLVKRWFACPQLARWCGTTKRCGGGLSGSAHHGPAPACTILVLLVVVWGS